MNPTQLLYSIEDRIATITLNRPDRMNAWTPTLVAEFRTAIEAAGADDGECVVMTRWPHVGLAHLNNGER